MSAINPCANTIQDSFCYIMEKNPKNQGKNKKGESSNLSPFAFLKPFSIEPLL